MSLGIGAGRRMRAGKLALVLSLIAALLFAAGPARADAVVVSEQPLDGWDTNGTVWTVKIVGDTVYIGGDFSLVRSSSGSSQVRNNLAAITISTGVVTSWRADTNSIVYAIDGNSNNLWIGGAFTTIAGVSRNRIASVNTATAAVRSGVDPNANGTVRKLHRTGGNVYVGGSFTAIDGTSMRHLVRIATGDGSVDLSWNPNPNHPVTGIDLPSAGDIVYVGGSFTTMGGQPHNYVVGLSPTDASVVTPPYANLTAKAIDLAVTPSGDRVMAGLGGLANRITVWNAATGAQSWRKIMDGDVQAVRYFSGNVYFGFHDAYQGDTNAKLMSADVYTRTLEPWRPAIPTFFGVRGVDITGAGLVAGEPFTSAEAIPTRGVAIFPTLGAPDPIPPSTPDNLVVTAATATEITLGWDPSTDNVAVTTYTVIRDGMPIGVSIDPFFTDTDLLPGTEYSYEVTAGDAASNESIPAGPLLASTSGAFVAAGDLWSYLDDGSNQGTAWRQPGFDTSAWAQGFAELGFGDGVEVTVLTSGFITYYFVKEFTVTGPLSADATLLIKRDDGVVVYINGTEAFRENMPGGTISYTTTASSTIAGLDEVAFIEGTLPTSLFSVGQNTIAVEIHQRSTGSSDISFDLALYADVAPDTTPPTVPQNPIATEVLDDSVSLAWDASTDDIELDNYLVRRDGVVLVVTTATTYTDTTVSAATMYTYTIEAVDVAGNPSGESVPVDVTTLSADVTAPSVPDGLTVVGTTETTVDLSWNPSTDDTGVAGYTVRRDGAIVGTPVGTTFTDIGLTADTTYSYTVDAFDAVPNTSVESAPLDATTAPPDTTAPSVPTDLTVSGTTATTADLTWTASTDDRAVTNYIVRRDGVVVDNVATPGFSDSGLVPGTDYDYTVEAEDEAGNPSGETAPVTATTAADGLPPTVPTSLTVTDTTIDSVTLGWGASTDDVAFDHYTVYRNGVPVGTTASTTFTDPRLAWSTTYTYEVTASDVAANESAPAGPVLATTDDNVVTTDLVIEGDTWSYLDDGSDQGTAWQGTGFDDSSWDSGAAQLGFGNGDETTVLTKGFITYYFRKSFTVNGVVTGDADLAVLRDDAVAVYINGVEVFTNNLPSTYNYLTGSTRTVAGSGERTFLQATVPASAFVEGVNVIAVEIHQRSLQSSDISFDLSLLADVAIGSPDNSPPTVPDGLETSNETLDSLTLGWNPAGDNVAVTLYIIRRDGVIIDSTSSTSYVDMGLASATTYSYTVAAQDAAGNTSSESSPIEGTTLTPDDESPTDPTGFSIDATTRTTVDISWTASTDNVAVTGYTIRVDGVIEDTTTATSYVATGLTADTTYMISVQAFDAAGNTSGEVGDSATTDPPDTTPPSDPSNLTVDGVTETTVALSWTASTDDEALDGYIVRREGVIVATPSATSFDDSGLTPDTTYDYTVQAIDVAGNLSAEVPV